MNEVKQLCIEYIYAYSRVMHMHWMYGFSCIAQILGCLTVVTFFGASNSDETESVMKLLWDLINPGTDSSV